ncbi:MAG: LysM peptidoglycan-binding domain-containing M23 family metallopeptidase, partial [Nitrolancea sp.]
RAQSAFQEPPKPVIRVTSEHRGRSAAQFGWHPDTDSSHSENTKVLSSPSNSDRPLHGSPRPLPTAPQPRFTQASVTASLVPAPIRDRGAQDGPEIWWPEASNRTIMYVGPAVRTIPQGNLTRTAMVAATVAAVASLTVLGTAVAGSVGQHSSPASVAASASASSSTSTAATSVPVLNYNGEGGGGQGVNYTVETGDTLHDIAAKYGISTQDLIDANDLANPDLIFPGDHVTIPGAGSSGQDITITVEAGDTINKLAERYGVDPSSIVNVASNDIADANLIIVGQSLVIPGANSSGSADAQGGGDTQATASLASTDAPQAVDTSASTNSADTQSQDQSQPDTTSASTDAAPAPTQQSTPAPTPEPTQAPQPAASDGFSWPVQGTITQNFGPTSFGLEPAYQGYAHFHQGLDIANRMYTPIHAAASGTVIFAGWSNSGYGFCVQIDHGNGIVTLYGHMAQQPSVSVGEGVSSGQEIGKMGSTGASTGSHLHFAVQKNGVWVNPLNYLP